MAGGAGSGGLRVHREAGLVDLQQGHPSRGGRVRGVKIGQGKVGKGQSWVWDECLGFPSLWAVFQMCIHVWLDRNGLARSTKHTSLGELN